MAVEDYAAAVHLTVLPLRDVESHIVVQHESLSVGQFVLNLPLVQAVPELKHLHTWLLSGLWDVCRLHKLITDDY